MDQLFSNTMKLFSNTMKTAAAVKKISGRKLLQALKAGTIPPDFAAKLAYGMQTGAVVVGKLPAKWARMMTGATRAGLAAERRAHRQGSSNGGPRVLYRHDLSDETIDTVVHQVGIERLMAVLDRATHPAVTINSR
jgi:hypothetical protein